MNRRLRILFGILVYSAIFEGLCAVGLFVLKKAKHVAYTPVVCHLSDRHQKSLRFMLARQGSHIRFDPDLGWVTSAGVTFGQYRYNSQGIRADREFSMRKPRGLVRIAAFGDSFTHGEEVSNPETWGAQFEKMVPGVEFMNFGVGAYGIDQALLRYRKEGSAFRPDIVLIGMMSGDIYRHVSVYRPYQFLNAGFPLVKPRFRLQNQKLILLPCPFRTEEDYQALLKQDTLAFTRLGTNDFFYQTSPHAGPLDRLSCVRVFKMARANLSTILSGGRILIGGRYNTQSEAFQVTVALLTAFHREALENGSRSVILLLPTRQDLNDHFRHRPKAYQPLMDSLRDLHLPYLDLTEAFGSGRADELDTDFRPKGHYSKEGNRLIARYLSEHLSVKVPAVMGTSIPVDGDDHS